MQKAIFPDGSEGDGLEGLRQFLREKRQQDYIENLCRKLLAFALGRTLQLSDDSLVAKMRATLAASDYRMDSLIETIVTSSQFLNQRSHDVITKK
jgi:hypothetical protein